MCDKPIFLFTFLFFFLAIHRNDSIRFKKSSKFPVQKKKIYYDRAITIVMFYVHGEE